MQTGALARCVSAPRLALGAPRTAARPARGNLQVANVGWDPEGILAEPQGGHIQRRAMHQQIKNDKELAEEREAARVEAREELLAARAARIVPDEPEHLVNYFLDTEMAEMEYEVSRCKPQLTPEFFAYLDQEIAGLRFEDSPDQGKVEELESLREFLKAGMEALDAMQEMLTDKTAAERLKELLSAPDKRAKILDMAGNNEIDQPLLMLLQQNIDMAKAAGQDKPAEFMEKVKAACAKYMMSTPADADKKSQVDAAPRAVTTYDEPDKERSAGAPIKPKRKSRANVGAGVTSGGLILDANSPVMSPGGSTPGSGGSGLIL